MKMFVTLLRCVRVQFVHVVRFQWESPRKSKINDSK